ncbi:hypothetical protein Y032_0377g270 [Ancylostoma ceylanicum]|uniref:Uncharacterized protein n=1 Tax=Ancylostoma ceylanicum TaxID=53326 RepID=A0A016RUL5_9BILA|nr:hypothetical protein Y032_0377g270 [Ancylostoma ceylanicum]
MTAKSQRDLDGECGEGMFQTESRVGPTAILRPRRYETARAIFDKGCTYFLLMQLRGTPKLAYGCRCVR